jgi:hypothetical protein
LTDLIDSRPDCPLFEVIIHPELSPTVRNEARQFIDYLKGQDSGFGQDHTRLETLLEWALTDKPNKWLAAQGSLDQQAQLARFTIFQPNRNASTVLAYPSRALWELIEPRRDDGSSSSLRDRVLTFLDPENCLRLSPIFAGHFQRIIECFLRLSAELDQWFPAARLQSLVDFCLENIDILAYQQLITHLMSDFATRLEPVYGESGFGFLKLILRVAVQRTLEVHNIFLRKSPQDQAELAFALQRSRVAEFNAFQKVPTNHEPASWKHKRIPTAKWLISGTADPHDLSGKLTKHILGRIQHFMISTQVPEEMLEKTKLRVFLLLNSIVQMVNENPDILCVLQNERNNYELIELLLLCGVLADPVSMVSVQAFRLLKMVLYGLDVVDVVTIEGIWTTPEVARLVDLYAGDFEFGDPLTPQMIAAFRLFWNHRYDNLTFEGRVLEPMKFPLVNEKGDDVKDQTFEHIRSPAMTPLERFGSFLLDEPPLSDAFNFQIFSVLKFWNNFINGRRNSTRRGDWFEWQKAIIRDDLVVVDFLRTPVRLGDRVVQLIEKLEEVMPLIPTHPFFQWCPWHPHAPLNGFVFELAYFVTETELFLIHDDVFVPCDLIPRLSEKCITTNIMPINALQEDFLKRAKLQPSGSPSTAGKSRSPPLNLPPLSKPGVELDAQSPDTGSR